MLHWFLEKEQDLPEIGRPSSEGTAEELRASYGDIAAMPCLRQVERMAKIGFWRLDMMTGSLFWSPEVFKIYAMDPDKPIDLERALSCYPPKARMRLEEALTSIKEQGTSYDLELDFVASDGVPKRIRTLGEPEMHDGETAIVFGIIQDISERYKLEQELREAALTDPLTGLPNRRHLELFYQDCKLDCASGPVQEFAMAIIDLDHFKAINDAHGHGAGDAALSIIADRLNAPWLSNCFAARLAGDEFVLIIQNETLLQDLVGLCERLLEAFSTPIQYADKQIELSATLGVATVPISGLPIHDVLECADAALYIAKAKGRGTAAISSREDMFMPPVEREGEASARGAV